MLILSLKQMISKALMLCPIPFPIVSLQAMSYAILLVCRAYGGRYAGLV